MANTRSGGSAPGKRLETATDEFLTEKNGNYALNLERVLERWIDWCDDRGVQTLEDVTPLTMRQYAARLDRRVRAQRADSSAETGTGTGIRGSTAQTYYNYVSAFLSWAVKAEYIAENPAAKKSATDPLPTQTSTSADQQFWQPEQRAAIVDYVDERARDAIDERETDAFEAVRNRALVTVLAYTGVRGSEVLADYRDDRRNGLRWKSVDLDDGRMWVLGKSQAVEDVGLTGQTIEPLRRLEQLVDPPSEEWPVFPSRHPPSLYSEIDASAFDRPDGDPWEYVLEKGIEPPAMSTSGARTLLKRLSKEAAVPGLELDDGEYLTLHGARRGVGEALYRERGAQRAQRTLRHADPKTTSTMYSHIEASELGADNTEVFENE